jgi:hypothetical protein
VGRGGHARLLVLNAPESFEGELAGLRNVEVLRALTGVKQVEFSLAFVTKQSEVDTLGKSIGAKAAGDAVVWFAYPTGSSKKYKCEFNRDTGWDSIGKRASNRSGWWRSTKTGQRSVSGVWNSSRR